MALKVGDKKAASASDPSARAFFGFKYININQTLYIGDTFSQDSSACPPQKTRPCFAFASRSQPSYRNAVRVADPDPVGSGVFAWIRIRFSNFSGSGSGSEENLKFMTKDRQKMKKATITYQTSS